MPNSPEKSPKKRYKRPPVEPPVKRDWLRRSEEYGESAPQIAEKDGYDVRTVRKQIELAREEREARQSRMEVLRDKIELHYQDLCRYAEDLRQSVKGIRVSAETTGLNKVAAIPVETWYLEDALRQHLPRSPIWNNLPKCQKLGQEVIRLEKSLENRIQEEITAYPGLAEIASSQQGQAMDGIAAVLISQGKAWAQGLPGLQLETNFQVKSAKGGMANVSYGFAQMGEVTSEQAAGIRKALIELESKIKSEEELTVLENTRRELEKVKTSLLDELAVILLKRIVPGKCKYCPL